MILIKSRLNLAPSYSISLIIHLHGLMALDYGPYILPSLSWRETAYHVLPHRHHHLYHPGDHRHVINHVINHVIAMLSSLLPAACLPLERSRRWTRPVRPCGCWPSGGSICSTGASWCSKPRRSAAGVGSVQSHPRRTSTPQVSSYITPYWLPVFSSDERDW